MDSDNEKWPKTRGNRSIGHISTFKAENQEGRDDNEAKSRADAPRIRAHCGEGGEVGGREEEEVRIKG